MTDLSRLLAIYVGIALIILVGVHVISCSRSAADTSTCCEKTQDGSDTRCYPCQR